MLSPHRFIVPVLKRQKTYLAQEPEAAGWAREGVPAACLPVTLAEARTVQRGLMLAQYSLCWVPWSWATQWLTYYKESTWPRDSRQAAWAEGLTGRDSAKLREAEASFGGSCPWQPVRGCPAAWFLINILSCLQSRSQVVAHSPEA